MATTKKKPAKAKRIGGGSGRKPINSEKTTPEPRKSKKK